MFLDVLEVYTIVESQSFPRSMKCVNRIETSIYRKIDAISSNVLEAKKGKSRDMLGQDLNLAPARGDILWWRGCKSKQVGQVTGFKTLLLCSVIVPIVGVDYQLPFWDELKKEKAEFHE